MGNTNYQEMSFDHILPLKHAMEEYTKGYSNMGADYSVTTLIQPPQLVQLTKRYAEQINVQKKKKRKDWEQLLASFMGTAVHNSLEWNLRRYITTHPDYKFNDKTKTGYLLERRLWDRIADRKISGQFDVYFNSMLYDWKVTKVWKAIYGDYTDWEEQLNLYAYFCSIHDIFIKDLFIVLWMKDWDKNKMYQQDYPKEPIKLIKLSLWPPEKQHNRFIELIEIQKANEDLPDNKLQQCSVKDRWAKPDLYAVMKKGQKRAKRVSGMTSPKIANEYIAKQKDKDQLYIQFRKGESLRCEKFCDAKDFCHQYKVMVTAESGGEDG